MSGSNSEMEEQITTENPLIGEILIQMKSRFNEDVADQNGLEVNDEQDEIQNEEKYKPEYVNSDDLQEIDKVDNSIKVDNNENNCDAKTPNDSKVSEELEELDKQSNGTTKEEEFTNDFEKNIVAETILPIENKREKKISRLPGRRSLRNKVTITRELVQEVKRSSRRLSKDCGETVLQSAIARKEKSYNETTKPQQRVTRRRKVALPTEVKITRNKRSITIIQDQIKSATEEIADVNLPTEEIDIATETEIKTKNPSDMEIESSADIKACDDERDRSKSFSSTSSSTIESRKICKRRKTATEDKEPLTVSLRRRSQRRSGSPHTAESTTAADLPPASDDNTIDKENTPSFKKCLCLKRTRITVEYKNTKEVFCNAVDSIDGKAIGCNNLTSIKQVRRSSTRVPFVIVCHVHFQRMLRHNSCPGCGMFCTEGIFMECSRGHYYHRNCVNIVDWNFAEQIDRTDFYCLHCGDMENQFEVKLTVCSSPKPVFLPFQRAHSSSAKMSIDAKISQPPMVTINGIILEIEANMEVPKLHPMNPDGAVHFSPDHLYEAAEKGDVEKLLEILTTKIDIQQSFDSYDGDTALHAACAGGHKIAAYILLAAGASINSLNASQKTPLMVAVLGMHADIINLLIKNGADTSFKGSDGMTALHLAAKIGYLEGCKILVMTSLIRQRNIIDEKDDGGWTPLVWACEHAHPDTAKYLLWRGADPNVRDLEQNVPLHWAAFGGDYGICEALLSLGADINAINVHKESPLHIAARHDRYDCLIVLLAHKALPDGANADGYTPLDCCGERADDCRNIISWNIKLRTTFSNLLNERDPILSNDITNGKELNPIQCVNYVDTESKPADFVYIRENCITSDIHIDRKITTLQSCFCEDRCGTPDCQCNNISLRCWYDDHERLIPEFDYIDPPMIFECNQTCACNTITCKNRVVQRGLTQRFQIFRTETKGWGVRTLRFIQRGTYVCEYIGEILSDFEADQRQDDSYLFDLDSRVCTVHTGLVTKVIINIPFTHLVKEGETYCIDARRYGNLARFINHHCSPNLLPVRVFIDHHDLHFPRIAFFANRDIAADEELGFDYGEKFWIIKCKLFTCTCGASNCRYSESTIESTLKTYRLKEDQIILHQQLQLAVS